jgi:mycothiol synthase
LLGYAFVLPGRRSRSTFWFELWTSFAAEERETASALLAALQPRVAALAAATAPAATVRLRLQVEERRSGLRESLEQRGFTVVRSPLLMVRDLDGRQEPEWPEGINIRTFVPADARAVHAFETEVLGDTWEFVAEPFETWVAQTHAANFDPSLWWVVEHNGELIGAMLTRLDPSDPELGWLHVIGVSSAWRGRSLGRALVLHALHELEARGMRRAGLGVDADNPTGACELARRCGFRIAQRFWTYEQRVRGPQSLRRLLHGARHVVRGRSRR